MPQKELPDFCHRVGLRMLKNRQLIRTDLAYVLTKSNRYAKILIQQMAKFDSCL